MGISDNRTSDSERIKILVVDDSRLLRLMMSDLLSANGYEVMTASNSFEAIDMAFHTFPPDLILMDIELGDEMDGIEAAKKILQKKDIPIIFLTAKTSPEIINRIKETTAYGYLEKKVSNEAIISAIEMALKLYRANSLASMFKYIFENAPNELLITDLQINKFITANKKARENLRYSEEEIKNLSPRDIAPEFLESPIRELIQKLYDKKETSVTFKTYHLRKDKTTYPVQVELNMLDYLGKKLCVANVQDLTYQKVFEKKLAEKDYIIKLLTVFAFDAIVVINDEGKVIFWNPAAERIFGYSEKEIINQDVHRILAYNYEKAETLFKDYLDKFRKTGDLSFLENPIELTAKNKNGEKVFIELTLSPLKLNEKWHAVGIARDITERKKSQTEIENMWRIYYELAENAPVGILRCDNNGNIIYINNKVLEILGSPSEEVTKKINLLTFPHLVGYGFSAKLKECLKNNKTIIYEVFYKSIWGKEFWARVHIKPHIESGKVAGALIILDDITERKILEEKIKRQAIRLRRLSYTDDLTGAFNRRYLLKKLQEEIERVKRYGGSFSIILLDIDNFKRINDLYGHNIGDLTLKYVVKTIKERIRKADTLARWGGEEFIIFLPSTPVDKASILAETLRENISRITLPCPEKVTASFGVASYMEGDTIDSLIKRADDLMYRAKEKGKNCVLCQQDVDDLKYK
ncbi:PAS domain S-box protein [Thermovenabulum sp.]|uniref:PAS domain S-box protein n=1 Tax=Thermovenabulum sp. TaxID=3100335 RepID=UPI003C7B387F